MAENTEPLCRAVARYIQSKIGVDTEYVGGIPWQERERMFDAGEIQVLWLCGLPYVQKAGLPHVRMELLAMPVPDGPAMGAGRFIFPTSLSIEKAPVDLSRISAAIAGLTTSRALIPDTTLFELTWPAGASLADFLLGSSSPAPI
jgi:hypothetical protein